MKKRFLLSLLRVYDNEKKNSHDYFPGMNYDASSIGVWFDTMEEALEARERLKEINLQAAYSVISYDDPWDLASETRKVMLNEKENELPFFDDDDLIFGDRDQDEIKIVSTNQNLPIATGQSSITIARLGAGKLYFCKNKFRMPITIEEAEALIKVSPHCVHLYANVKGEEPF